MNKIIKLITINQIENLINIILHNHRVDLCLYNNNQFNNNQIIYLYRQYQHISQNRICQLMLMKHIQMDKDMLERKLMEKKKVEEDYIIKKVAIMMEIGKMTELMDKV